MKLLMHKNDIVCEVKMAGNIPRSFGKIFNKDLIPVGLDVPEYKQNVYIPNTWYAERSIPRGRMDVEKIIGKLGITPSEGFLKSLGVSLTDCYWIKDDSSPLSWEDVNYHDNGFEPVFFLADNGLSTKDIKTPDFTTAGVLEKYWTINTGRPYLVKTSDKDKLRIIANEVVVSYAASLMGIDHVTYDHVKINEKDGCGCLCFIDSANEDFVTLTDLLHAHEVSRMALSDILWEKFPRQMDNLAVLDTLFMQEDRHGGNAGIIIKEGQSRFAPIFDSGNCLGYIRGINNAISYDDYKLTGASFAETLERVEHIPDIPFDNIKRCLKQTYEDFSISEEGYEVALKVLNHGYEMIKDAQRMIVAGYDDREDR